MEEAFYDSPVLRRFAGVDLGVAAAPDETTILRFRHLLEQHDLCGEMLMTVNRYLETQGHPHHDRHHRRRDDHPRALLDEELQRASAIPRCIRRRRATSGTSGCQGAHRRGQQGDGGAFGDVTFAASVADKHMLPDLLHGDERKVWGDGGYQGQTEAIHEPRPKAQDMTCRRTKYKNYVDEEAKRKNTTKARVRAKVEHPFRILKRVFGFTKVRYRGIWKNHQWLCAAFALVNLYQHRNRLAPQGRSVSGGRKTASQRRKGNQQPASSDTKLLHNQEIIRSRVAATKSRTCAEVP